MLSRKVIPMFARAAALAPSLLRARPMSGKSPEHCKQMMAERTQLMAERKAMDATLARSIVAMNGAHGSAKVDTMAAVINEMATQRTQLMAKSEAMQDNMTHMAEHMSQSGAAMKDSMSQCPR